MTINQKHADFLAGRKISVETATRLGIYSGALQSDGGNLLAQPDERGSVLCFPFVSNGQVVNEKYRLPGKQFRQMTGGRQIFYNADILRDEYLREGVKSLLIVEGEMDALSAIEAGYDYVVSIPAGAVSPKKEFGNIVAVPDDTRDIDPADDKKFEFIYANIEDLMKIPSITIAMDNDENGRCMADELVRRLGRVRCSFVTMPDGCKDLNDVLMKHGTGKVIQVITSAKPYPLSGVYKLEDLPTPPALEYVSTGFPQLGIGEFGRLHLTYPGLMVVTGCAGQGKTTWTQQLVTNLANLHGWKAAIASFEMMIQPYVTNAIGAAYNGKPAAMWDHADTTEVRGFINDNFVFIAPDDNSEEAHDLDWLIKKAEDSVIRHNIRVLLIDPWNEIDHQRERNESGTEYTNRALMRLKVFAKAFRVLVIVVAHPTKSGAEKGEAMTLYDISDSAAFQNKADYGVVVARQSDADGTPSNMTSIAITKIRNQPDAGLPGAKVLAFDAFSRTFS